MNTANTTGARTKMATNTTAIVPETVYKSVLYQDNIGTLKLNDEQLSFHTQQKVSVLPWNKVVRRQVLSAGGGKGNKEVKHKTKLILESGNEAIFQVQDRVSLEVLRDDLAERLLTYRKNFKPEEDEAVNKTVAPASRRMSTPYRFVSATSARNLMTEEPRKVQQQEEAKEEPEPPKPRQERRMSTPYRFVSASARNLTKEPSKRSVTKKERNNTNNNGGMRDSSHRSESSRGMDDSSGRRGMKDSSHRSVTSEPVTRRESSTAYRFVAPSVKESSRRSVTSSSKDSTANNTKRNGAKEPARRESAPFRFITTKKYEKEEKPISPVEEEEEEEDEEEQPARRKNSRYKWVTDQTVSSRDLNKQSAANKNNKRRNRRRASVA